MNFDLLIENARKDNCSDVHITVGTSIARRRFSKLEFLPDVPTAEESEEMIMEKLTEEQRAFVRAGNDLDFSIMLEDGLRIRANIYHQRNNLAAVYRILHKTVPTFEELHLPATVRKFVDASRGLVLVTGPTGSGKTTTMASMVNFINHNMNKHVITIEDPIEYVYYRENSMIHQREIGKDVKDFPSALRSALREDPDVILVGEMRDYETIRAAITAAETGHLVLSTLHTNNAAQTVERIIESYPANFQNMVRAQLASVLQGIVTQVLIPSIKGDSMEIATEVLVNNDAISNQIRDNKIHQILGTIQSNAAIGMHTMDSDIKRLVKEWRISSEMALKFAANPKTVLN